MKCTCSITVLLIRCSYIHTCSLSSLFSFTFIFPSLCMTAWCNPGQAIGMFWCCSGVWACVHTLTALEKQRTGAPTHAHKARLCFYKHHIAERQGRVENHRRGVMTKRCYTSPYLFLLLLLPRLSSPPLPHHSFPGIKVGPCYK